MATEGKDMLKQTLTGLSFVFLGLLLCVEGEEGFSDGRLPYDTLANLVAGFKENCPDHQDILSCLYWDSNIIEDVPPPNALTNKQTEESATAGKDTVEETEFLGNHLQKRLLVQRRKNPMGRGYKRGPGFRSWGGKRDSTLPGQSLGTKNKFGPWGGKRDEEHLPSEFSASDPEGWKDKRARFVSWGGKRSSPHSEPTTKRGSIWKDRGFYLSEPFIKNVPKRPQFQSWGGKRALYPWNKMSGFTASHPSTRYTMSGGEKRKFSSWGGKRYEKNAGSSIRHVFQNWGGKRQSTEEDVLENFPGVEKEGFGDGATPSNDIAAMKPGWEGDEPLRTSSEWDGKGGEGNMR